MKKRSIAPYIQRNRKQVETRAGNVVKGRIDRFISPIFAIPEYSGWNKIAVVFLTKSSLPSIEGLSCFSMQKPEESRNLCMNINKSLIDGRGKVICIVRNEIEMEKILEANDQILSSSFNLIICSDQILAMSFELFHLAKGLDELLKSTDDAIIDLALRAELLGGKLSNPAIKSQANGWSKKNVEKGCLIVNQGSENFN